MKEKPSEFAEAHRRRTGVMGSSSDMGNNGAFQFHRKGVRLSVIISDGGDWDHVSVSCSHRCPNWEEMCWVKEIFFEPTETVVQFHPPESEYVNNHPTCLHMWRPQKESVPLPPAIFVGYKELGTVR